MISSHKIPEEQNTLNLFLQQSFLALDQPDYAALMQHLLGLGAWLQERFTIPHYYDYDQVLIAALSNFSPSFKKPELEQAFALRVFENAWCDPGLARIRSLSFSKNLASTQKPNSCLFLKIDQAPYWQVIPIDDKGQRKVPLNLTKLGDAALIAAKLPNTLLDKDPKRYGSAEKIVVTRLLRALRAVEAPELDQSALMPKSQLSLSERRQLRLGLEALKYYADQAQALPANTDDPVLLSSAKKPEPIEFLTLYAEPTKQERALLKSNSYIFIPPVNDRATDDLAGGGAKGRLLYCAHPAAPVEEVFMDGLDQVLAHDEWHEYCNLYTKGTKQRAQEEAKVRFYALHYHQQRLDEKAREAISHHEKRWQTLSRQVGNVLAAITAVTYGGVELVATMLGFYLSAGIVWTNPLMALLGCFLLSGALILPFPSTWANWKVFSTYMPEFFNKIQEEYREIHGSHKKALFWGLSLFALATGIAGGGLAYTSTIVLPGMLGLSVNGSAALLFPPLGVLLGAAIVVTQTCSLIRNFAKILRREDSLGAFVETFLKVEKVLHDSNAGNLRRLTTWVMVASLALLSVLGLGMSCFTSTRSVGKFFVDQLHTAPQKALLLGAVIGAFGAFFARVYFTLDSAISAALILSRRVFRGNPENYFSKDYDQYEIINFSNSLSPEQALRSIGPGPHHQKIFLMPVAGREDLRRAFYVMDNKLVNSGAGILETELILTNKAERTLDSSARVNEEETTHSRIVRRAVTAATAELIAKENKPLPISPSRVAAIAIDATTAGGFYAQNMLALAEKTAEDLRSDVDIGVAGMSQDSAVLLATGALLTAGARYVAIDLKHADTPDDPQANAREAAAERRAQLNRDYYLSQAPATFFREARAMNWGFIPDDPLISSADKMPGYKLPQI